MIYPSIAATLGWGNDYEVTAEGLFLQPEEASTLEQALDQTGTNATRVQELTNENTTLQTTVEERDATISTQSTRISELEAEVTRLNAEPSGNGSNLQTPGDQHADQKPVPSYLSDNNPANEWADRRMKR